MILKSTSREKKPRHHLFFLSVLIQCFVHVACSNADKCHVNSKTNPEDDKLFNRISPLFGKTFNVEKDGFTYNLGICTDVQKSHENISLTRVHGEKIVQLGRRNETQISGGDTWVLLRYGCDKCLNKETKCLGNHSASIYIVCDPIDHDEIALKLTEDDDCHYTFVFPTTIICEHEKEVSGGTVFVILLSVSFFMYFIVGIVYRRLVHNAQGCQQLPHFSFWQRIGALCSDGCNYLCRCNEESEDPWFKIASSTFNNGDRDDALLNP